MEKSFKYRIYPTPDQIGIIQRTFGCARFVYNYFLAKRKELYESSKATMNYVTCSGAMTTLKKELPWLREVDSTALQSSLRDLDTAYQNFFRGYKSGKHIGYPRFHSKHDNHKSYKSKHVGGNIKVLDKTIQLPKLGFVECRVSRPIEGRILSATVSQTPSGKYFVALCCTDVDIPQYESTGVTVGIDLGLKDLAVTSEGVVFDNHRHLRESEKKLARLQRQLSRKPKGSRNRDKARIKVARQHERIANQRNDMLHKLSTSLVKDYDVIVLETLRPKNMLRNRRLAKLISDASWGEFARQIEYKASWQHKIVVKVDPFFPSSQTCNMCGHQNADTKDLSVRTWDCPKCGTHHDRDQNAAKNILNEGLRLLNATTVGHTESHARGEHVRRNAATLAEPGIPRL